MCPELRRRSSSWRRLTKLWKPVSVSQSCFRWKRSSSSGAVEKVERRARYAASGVSYRSCSLPTVILRWTAVPPALPGLASRSASAEPPATT